MADDLAELDVFYGELTAARAYIYARLPRPAHDAGLALTGQVRGPRCLYGQTLPLTAPLTDLGPGPTLLARALLPDPTLWSADVPAIYDVVVNFMRGKQVIASQRREIGLRALGIRGRDLVCEGKRWVLRGISASSTTARLPRHWHEAWAAYVTDDPHDEERLAEASQWGAWTMVEIRESGHAAVAALRKIACFPGVGTAVFSGSLPPDFKPSHVAPNVLPARLLPRGGEFILPPWARLAFADADDPRFPSLAAVATIPLAARRLLPRPVPIDQARAACDRLQRDLAPLGQFAGYVV